MPDSQFFVECALSNQEKLCNWGAVWCLVVLCEFLMAQGERYTIQ
jgi:hypothetical protein